MLKENRTIDFTVRKSTMAIMKTRLLTALPVYNEVSHVADVLTELKQHVDDILVVDDGSSDGTAEVLKQIPGICVERHVRNLGYGAALNTAFQCALEHGFDVLVTMDCDGQHQPRFVREIARLIDESSDAPIDMASGSRYLIDFEGDNAAPADRRAINKRITECLNEKLGLSISDAFCGFKAYRVSSLANLDITDNGYAMPLQLWIQAVDLNWNIREFAVPRVYLEEARSFGGSLDDANVRLAHYRSVLNAELERRGMDQRFTSDCGATSAR